WTSSRSPLPSTRPRSLSSWRCRSSSSPWPYSPTSVAGAGAPSRLGSAEPVAGQSLNEGAALPSVHVQTGADHERRGLRGEEHDGGRHFVRTAEAAERQLARHERRDPVGVGLATAVPGASRE